MAFSSGVNSASFNHLIGREALLQELLSWVNTQGAPGIFCLYGPEGVGKTRLADELWREIAESFGVVTKVPMDVLEDTPDNRNRFLERIAECADADDVQAAATDLPAYCRQFGKRLLILDGFERVECSETITAVTELAGAGIRCLITSHNPFPVESGVVNREVSRLALPTSAAEDVTRFEGEALFWECLPATSPLKDPQRWSQEDREALIGLLQVTEGLPRAIQVLGGSISAAPSVGAVRISSLPELYAWAVDLLPEQERERFQGLGVFPFDFHRFGAIPVCEVSDELLDSWERRGLLEKDHFAEELRLSEPVKAQSWGRSDPEFQQAMKTRLVAIYTATLMKKTVNGQLDIQDETLDRILGADWRVYFALRSVAVALEDLSAYLNLNAIDGYLLARGFWDEARELWWEQSQLMQALAEEEGISEVRIRSLRHYDWLALNNLAHLYLRLGHWEGAEFFLRKSAYVADLLGNQRDTGHALANIASIHIRLKRWPEAIESLEHALPLMRAGGDDSGYLNGIGNLAELQLTYGDTQRALAGFTEQLELARLAQQENLISRALVGKGAALGVTGKLAEGIDLVQQGIARLIAQGDEVTLPYSQDILRQLQERATAQPQ